MSLMISASMQRDFQGKWEHLWSKSIKTIAFPANMESIAQWVLELKESNCKEWCWFDSNNQRFDSILPQKFRYSDF